MNLVLTFLKRYPSQSVVTLFAMLFAGIAEGFGMSMLLPLLTLSFDSSGSAMQQPGSSHSPSSLEIAVSNLFAFLHIHPTVGLLLILFVMSIIIKVSLVLIANRQVGYMVARVATDLRLDLIRAIFASRWEYFVHQSAGAFTNSFATEAQRSASAYLFGMRIIALLLNCIVYISVAMMVTWRITLLALVVGSLILYLLKQLVIKAKQAGKNQTDKLKSLISLMTDTLQSIKPLKAMAREQTTQAMLEQETLNLNHALRMQVFSREALRAMQEPLMTIFFSAGLYIALVTFNLSISSVLVMVYMLNKILKTLQRAQRQHQSMVIAESAYWSMQSRIQEAQKWHEQWQGTKLPAFTQEIRLDNVSFSYDSKAILNNISVTFPKGRFITLAGPSGVGKTTLADLICGLMVPSSGEILIDHTSLSEFDIKKWRKMIGYVAQETMLLHDSIMVNITLGDKSFTEADVEYALKRAGAWEFVSRLPDGIHTVTGERGSRLSGGQRQRITIARALIHRPQILILDEATSALDPASEKEICETLKNLAGDLTIFAISHHDRMIDAADMAFILNNGALEPISR